MPEPKQSCTVQRINPPGKDWISGFRGGCLVLLLLGLLPRASLSPAELQGHLVCFKKKIPTPHPKSVLEHQQISEGR